jgi:PAS domain S-box-containing protein
MKQPLRVLHLEDSPADAELIRETLADGGLECEVIRVDTRQDFADALEQSRFDVVLADYTLPAFDGLSALAIVKETCPDVPFIFVTGTLGEDIAIETMKKGATDYVLKGKLSRLVPAVRRAFKEAEERSERKRAEEALRKSEELYRTLVSASPDAITMTDLTGSIMFASSKAFAVFGHSMSEDLIGRSVMDWVASEERSKAQANIQYTLTEGHPRDTEYTLLKKDGTRFSGEINASPVRSADGDAVGIMIITRDVTERKRAEERVQRQIKKLSALRSIDMAISSNLDLRITLNIFVAEAMSQLDVDAANVLLLNSRSNLLEYAASRGFRTSALKHSHLRVGEGYAGTAALENRIVSIPNLTKEDTGFKRSKLLEGEDFISYYAVPLVAKGHVVGVLEIFHRSPLEPDEEWFEFLDALALQAAIAIDNNSLFYDLERSTMDLTLAYDSTIEGWSRALDYRDKETEGHSQRVTEMTLRIAREMGINEEELVHVRRGALLHDIGKMGIPDSILLKAGPLTDEEWKIMRLHPVYSYDLLHPIAYLRPALDIPYCHHEKWDGSGYPRGLKAEQIPLSARIFAVVDVWDALRSDRPYRPAWPEEKTIEHIRSLSGIQFDPKVMEAFLRAIAEKKD